MNIEVIEFLINTVPTKQLNIFLKYLEKYMFLFGHSEMNLENISDIYHDEFLTEYKEAM